MTDTKISQLTGATTPLAGTEEVPLVQSSATKKVTVANLTAGRSVKMDSLGLGGSNPVSYAAIEWDPSAAVTYGIELTPLLNANTTNVQMVRARPRATANTHTDVTAYYAGLDGLASSSTTTTAYGFRVTNPTGGVTNLYGVHSAITSGAGRYHIYLNTDANSYTAGNWQFASGKGIDFSANTSAAGMTSELLNDYEEGTFTPVVADADTGGNTATGTFTGNYTKIGRIVHVTLQLVNIDTTGMTAGNNLIIRGLPFTAVTFNQYPCPISWANLSTGGNIISGSVLGATASLYLVTSVNGGSNGYIKVSAVTSGSCSISVNVTYQV